MSDGWQDKALHAARGTRTGAILRCALDRNEEGHFPQFTGKASVTSDGFLMCDFIDREGRQHLGAFVGSVDDFWDNVRGLNIALALDAEDSIELVEAFRSWIGKDWRAR